MFVGIADKTGAFYIPKRPQPISAEARRKDLSSQQASMGRVSSTGSEIGGKLIAEIVTYDRRHGRSFGGLLLLGQPLFCLLRQRTLQAGS